MVGFISRFTVALVFCLLLDRSLAAPTKDLIDKVPGFPDDFKGKVYSGYLDIKKN